MNMRRELSTVKLKTEHQTNNRKSRFHSQIPSSPYSYALSLSHTPCTNNITNFVNLHSTLMITTSSISSVRLNFTIYTSNKYIVSSISSTNRKTLCHRHSIPDNSPSNVMLRWASRENDDLENSTN